MKFERRREWGRHLASAGILVGTIVACDENHVSPPKGGPSLWVSPPSAVVLVGDSVKFTAQIVFLTNKEIAWVSSDRAVATVDSTGLVRAHSVGRATVTVQSLALRNVRASVIVDVRQ